MTVEYILESTDASIISSARSAAIDVSGTSGLNGFAMLLASQLTLAGVSATVAAVAAPVVKAEVVVEVVSEDAAVVGNDGICLRSHKLALDSRHEGLT